MTRPNQSIAPRDESLVDESLITQSTLRQLAGGVSDMTIWRWRKAGLLPKPTTIRNRNYWRNKDVRSFLQGLTTN